MSDNIFQKTFRKLFSVNKELLIYDVPLDVDRNLCFYTRNRGKELLFHNTHLPKEIINLIVEYTDNYRNDDLPVECNSNYKSIIYYTVRYISFHIHLVTIIIGKNEQELNKLAIKILLQLEIDYKKNYFPKKPQRCTLMLTNSVDKFVNNYKQAKNDLNEPWMLKDVSVQSKDELITKNNNFKICFNLDVCKPTDEFEVLILNIHLYYNQNNLSEELKNIIKSTKNIILLAIERDNLGLRDKIYLNKPKRVLMYLRENLNTAEIDLKIHKIKAIIQL